jgi:hypothetical protein
MANNNREIKITLQKIRDASPCVGGWNTVLRAHRHLGMNTEFPLSSVLDSNGLDDTLWCLRCLPEHKNLWRKYAVWCVRNVEYLLTDERSRDALNVAWRHSDGLADDGELAAAWVAAWVAARVAAQDAARGAAWVAAWVAARAAQDAARAAQDAARGAAWVAAWVAAQDAARGAARVAAWVAQRAKLLAILTAGEWVEDNGGSNGE